MPRRTCNRLLVLLLLTPAPVLAQSKAEPAPAPVPGALDVPPEPPPIDLPERAAPEALSLNDAVSEALSANLGVINARLDKEDAKATVLQSWMPFEPSVNVYYSLQGERTDTFVYSNPVFTDSQNSTVNTSVRGGFWTGTRLTVAYTLSERRERTESEEELFNGSQLNYFQRLDFTLTQNLLQGFGPWRNRAPILQAEAAVEAADSALAAAQEQVLADVVNAWAALRAARLAVVIAEDDLALARRQRKETVEHIRAGLLAPSAVYNMDEGIAAAQSSLLNAHRTLVEAETALRRILGRSRMEGTAAPLIGSGDLPFLPDREVEPSQIHALRNNPELDALRADLRAREVALRASVQGRLPMLDLNATLSFNGLGDTGKEMRAEFNSGENRGYDISLNFTLPLAAFEERSEHRKSKVALERSLRQLSEQEQVLLDRVETAVLTVRNRAADKEVAARRVVSSEMSLSAAELRFSAGQTSTRDVMEARQNLAQARLAALRAETDDLSARVELERLRGSLSETLGLTWERDEDSAP